MAAQYAPLEGGRTPEEPSFFVEPSFPDRAVEECLAERTGTCILLAEAFPRKRLPRGSHNTTGGERPAGDGTKAPCTADSIEKMTK